MEETKQQHYDAIIIGSGQGGIPLAKDLAEAGWKVAIVEENYVGGSCVNYGCTPTKTLIASAQVAHSARHAASYGIHTGQVQVNMQQVKERRDSIVQNSRDNNASGLHKSEAELIRGKASFQGSKTVAVQLDGGGATTLTADKVFINTGASPSIPEVDGLQGTAYLTHITIQDLTEVPDHLLILGGGYIALEFGQMFRRFGSRVTIVQHSEQLLGREDEDVAQEMKSILEDEGITVLLKTEPQQVSQHEKGIRLAVTSENGERQELEGSHLLVATGVKPTTAGLGLEKAGVETDEKGNIKADKHLHTSAEGVFVIGDVKGGPQFTHISYDDYRILRDKLLQGISRATTDRPVPYCVFTDPQLGRVGMSEKQAKKEGINYKVAKLPVSKVARGQETGQTKGFYKVLVNPDSKLILGAAIIAPEGGEIMSMLQLAMMGKLTYTQLQEGVFAHPTYAESLNNLFMALDS